ncbi:MAG: hypothetical protein L3J58_04705 [Emcibacter sp.]|nr:hypothetical protein [Emcibacter sp.]
MSKKHKRPRDPNQLAKYIVDIAVGKGEDSEYTASQEKASRAGKVGGKARAKSLTPQERSEIAQIAANTRWKKSD